MIYRMKLLIICILAGSKGSESITQIMWPSHYIEGLRDGPIHKRLGLLAKCLLGEDMMFDFDMIISKVGYSFFGIIASADVNPNH